MHFLINVDTGNIDFGISPNKLPRSGADTALDIPDYVNDLIGEDYKEAFAYYAKPAHIRRDSYIYYILTKAFAQNDKSISKNKLEGKYEIHHTLFNERHPHFNNQLNLLQQFYFKTRSNIPEELSQLHPYSTAIESHPNTMADDIAKEWEKFDQLLSELHELSKKRNIDYNFDQLDSLHQNGCQILPEEFCLRAYGLNKIHNLIIQEIERHSQLEKELSDLKKY